MYNDKAIDKVINLVYNIWCPRDIGLENGCKDGSLIVDQDCHKCWKQALSTEPEGDHG